MSQEPEQEPIDGFKADLKQAGVDVELQKTDAGWSGTKKLSALSGIGDSLRKLGFRRSFVGAFTKSYPKSKLGRVSLDARDSTVRVTLESSK